MAATLAVTMLLSLQAAAPSAADLADARCMLAIHALVEADKSESQGKEAASASALFFIGKIVGRSGAAAFEAAGAEATKGIDGLPPEKLRPIAETCLAEMGKVFESK